VPKFSYANWAHVLGLYQWNLLDMSNFWSGSERARKPLLEVLPRPEQVSMTMD